MESVVFEIAALIASWADHHPVVKTIYLFGSVVRGEAHAGSDLDLLIEFDDTIGGMVTRGFFEEGDALEELKSLVGSRAPWKVSVHTKPDDQAWNYVRSGKEMYRVRKVICIWTNTKPG
jgi:predicted nucleotidyltransferase